MTRPAALLLMVLAAAPAPAADYHVAPDGVDDPARDGLSPAAAWASLAYACDRVPAGRHAVRLAPGTYTATRTARPKDGVTVTGAGRDGASATTVVAAKDWPLGDVLALPKPAAEFLVAVNTGKDVTVRDLALASDPGHRISGAVFATGTTNLSVTGVAVREFRWAGVYVEHSSRAEVGRCVFENASAEKDKFRSGAIRSRWLKDSTIHHNRVTAAADANHGYGYKAGGHERVRFHHNFVDVPAEFAVESAHENEYGLEIDHNHLSRCISVPKSGQGADPNTRKCEYSVRIHHNLLTDSYTVEGPRNHLRVDHNYVRVEKTGGRVYSVHGGENDGPVWIHHNVVENLDRAFVWKNRGRAAGVCVWNNTVYAADAGTRAAPFVDAFHDPKQPVRGWVVRNNVFVAPAAQPRKLFQDRNDAGSRITLADNLCVNLTGVPAGNVAGADPGFRLAGGKPVPFYAPAAAASLVVDRGADVGLPFKGKAPDLGAVEWGDDDPFPAVGPDAP